MVKLKAPLLSLEAHQGLGKHLTFRTRGQVTIGERKPIPVNPRTLPQYYQRWLYQDYIAWWHTLSLAQKRVWETNARPYHMTGFAYWMKDRLSTLPDIVAGYTLDSRPGTLVKDFSKNNNDGTLHGPTYQLLAIAEGLSGDGINDWVGIPHTPSLNLVTNFTIELYLYVPSGSPGDKYILAKQDNSAAEYALVLNADKTLLFAANGIPPLIQSTSALAFDTIYHLAFTQGEDVGKIFIDGNLDKSGALGASPPATVPLHLFARGTTPGNAIHFLQVKIDHLIMRNRVLTQTELLPHVKRRYPL